MFRGFTLTPEFKVRLVAAQFDGYTETGSSANLTVGSRTVQGLEERAVATLAYVGYAGAKRITLYGQVDSRNASKAAREELLAIGTLICQAFRRKSQQADSRDAP